MSQPAFDFSAEEPEAEPTLGVGELLGVVNATLRRTFREGFWVRGEISGLREGGPHLYFRLVEETDAGKASLDVSLFAPSRGRLRPVMAKHGMTLADGIQVRIHGSLDVYAPTGRLSLKMDGIDPRHTLGDLAAQRHRVLQMLVAKGLFDANRRTRLAAAPLRLGVVTSAASAAWADFRHELERSGLGFHVRLADVRVQGDQAVPMITRAIAGLSRRTDIDAVVVIRGGGARTELATFDHEQIALAICASPVPVFTGLGHEIDRSVADEVAHTALKTPTACATCLVEHVRGHLDRCEDTFASVVERARRRVADADAGVVALAHGIRHHTVSAVSRSAERLDHRAERLRGRTDRRLVAASGTLDQAAAQLVRRAPSRIDDAARRLDALAAQARLLDPVHTMARGWSITRDADGHVVRHAATVTPGAVLHTQLARGSLTSTVTSIDVAPTSPSPDDPTGDPT